MLDLDILECSLLCCHGLTRQHTRRRAAREVGSRPGAGGSSGSWIVSSVPPPASPRISCPASFSASRRTSPAVLPDRLSSRIPTVFETMLKSSFGNLQETFAAIAFHCAALCISIKSSGSFSSSSPPLGFDIGVFSFLVLVNRFLLLLRLLLLLVDRLNGFVGNLSSGFWAYSHFSPLGFSASASMPIGLVSFDASLSFSFLVCGSCTGSPRPTGNVSERRMVLRGGGAGRGLQYSTVVRVSTLR